MRGAWAVLSAVLVLSACSSGTEPGPQSTSTPEPVTSEEWRTEVWRDVQLEVPAGWTLGYAPMPDGDAALLCGVGPLEYGGEPDRPYVGRPGAGSDMCVREELEDVGLDRAGVWFDSVLPVGDVVAKTGLRQVTVGAGGTRVTVASEDGGVLERVVASVDQVRKDANGCPEEPDRQRGYPDEGYGEPLSLSVCVYERRRGAEPWQRLWTASLPVARAGRLLRAVDAARPGEACSSDDGGQLVLLRLGHDDPMGDEPLLRDLLVRPSGCASLQAWGPGGGSWLALEPDLVRPWAVEGVRSYVWSDGQPRPVSRFFRPLWG